MILAPELGILALAAERFGAKRVIAIDDDPVAIATARANARRNKLDNIDFRVADVRRWPFPPRIEIITANLFSELLIEILPKLKRAQLVDSFGYFARTGGSVGPRAEAKRDSYRGNAATREMDRNSCFGGSAHSLCAGSDILSDALREAPQDAELGAQDVRATPG